MFDIEEVLKIPAPILLIVALNVIAACIRRIPGVSNWWIPFAVLGLGTLIYPQITTKENTTFNQTGPFVLYLQGFMLAAASFGADSLLAKFDFYKRLTGSFQDAYTQGKAPGEVPTPEPPK